jgi:hypothetical protein
MCAVTWPCFFKLARGFPDQQLLPKGAKEFRITDLQSHPKVPERKGKRVPPRLENPASSGLQRPMLMGFGSSSACGIRPTHALLAIASFIMVAQSQKQTARHVA